MTEDQSAPIFESWLKGTDVPPPDAHQSAREVALRLPQTRQRGSWWPLPSLRRRPPASPARDIGSPSVTGRTRSLVSPASVGTATALVFAIAGLLAIAQPFDGPGGSLPGAATGEAGAFRPAGTVRTAQHTATLLPDGRMLVVGGGPAGWPFAWLWDQAGETFDPTGDLVESRANHTATLLPDGRVLVIGGCCGFEDARDTAEVWDPATETFEQVGLMAHGRSNHTATLLSDGRVLVIGGWGDVANDTAEVWDPATEAFEPAGELAKDRYDHTATLLPDGRVLVVGGGVGYYFDPVGTAEIWDPATEAFGPAGSLTLPRGGHTASLLRDGRVLIVGGNGDGDILASADVWDPTTGTFGPAGSLAVARAAHTTTPLADGRLLVVGGGTDAHTEELADNAEVWDPATETFGPAGVLGEARAFHTATLLGDGSVLVVGGEGSDGVAELWEPTDR